MVTGLPIERSLDLGEQDKLSERRFPPPWSVEEFRSLLRRDPESKPCIGGSKQFFVRKPQVNKCGAGYRGHRGYGDCQ